MMAASGLLQAQNLVLDTLIVPLNLSRLSLDESPKRIWSILEKRNVENPALLNIDEINRFIFVPVDRKILADRPVVDGMMQALNDTLDSGKKCRLDLNHLEFSAKKVLFVNRYALNASVTIYRDDQPAGELVYEYRLSRLLGLKIKPRYQRLMQGFLSQLYFDLNGPGPESIQSLPNFRNYSERPIWMQLLAGAEMTILPGGHFLFDGTLNFTYPEAGKFWMNPVSVMRYRRMASFESVEWGISSAWLNFRFHPKGLFRMKTQLMFGINRWNDMKTFKHELYDALLLDFSLGQSIHFHPKNARGITFGLGLLENVYYVYSMGMRFDAGLTFQAGVQF